MPDTLPDFPLIDGLSWAPPANTGPVEVNRVVQPLYIRADADNADYADNVLDQPAPSGNPRLNNWWPGHEPAGPRMLILRHFWRMVPGTFTHIAPGTHLSKSWAYTHGVSTTDSQSITATVGIAAEGLSAGLSATFSHSITISDQQTQTTTFTVDPPADGQIRVWVLWDLMYEFLIVNQNNGQVLPTGTYRGDVGFSNDEHYSGAYLNYPWTHLIVSSGNLCSQQREFTAL
jgi:hypothetical protein